MSLSIQADTSAIYGSNSSLFSNSKISASSSSSKVATTTNSSDDEEATAVSSQGDTLTISSVGSNLAASAASSSSDSSSSSDDDLSQYSEIQLQQMLQNGEITQAQYDAEIQSRESSDTATTAQASDSEQI